MTASATEESTAAPRAAMLLPVAMLLHMAEEWFGGFSAWTLIVLGREVTPERFVQINAIGFAFFGIGTLAAFLVPRMAWFAATFAALVGLNAVVHTLATLGWGRYSPGTITGLVLYVPLSIVVLRASAKRLSGGVFAGAVVFGVLIHVLVTSVALR